MPVIRLLSLPLPKEKKAAIAPRLYEEALKDIKVPHIEIFFEECEDIWSFGKPVTENRSMTCIVEAGVIASDALEDMAVRMMNVLRQELDNPKYGFVLVYHVNDDDHVTYDDEILSRRRKRLNI